MTDNKKTICRHCRTGTDTHLRHFEAQSQTLTMSLLFKSRKGFTMVSNDNDIDTAMKVHLLQAIHQLTNDVINLSQRVVQL